MIPSRLCSDGMAELGRDNPTLLTLDARRRSNSTAAVSDRDREAKNVCHAMPAGRDAGLSLRGMILRSQRSLRGWRRFSSKRARCGLLAISLASWRSLLVQVDRRARESRG